MTSLHGFDPVPDPPEDDVERKLCEDLEREAAGQWQSAMTRLLSAAASGGIPASRAMRLVSSLTERHRALRAVLRDQGYPDEEDESADLMMAPRRGRVYPRTPPEATMVGDLVGGLTGMAGVHEMQALVGLTASPNPEIRRLAEARVLMLLQDRAGQPAGEASPPVSMLPELPVPVLPRRVEAVPAPPLADGTYEDIPF